MLSKTLYVGVKSDKGPPGPRPERTSTWRLIEHHAPELAEDYDSLITLADLEFGPPPQG